MKNECHQCGAIFITEEKAADLCPACQFEQPPRKFVSEMSQTSLWKWIGIGLIPAPLILLLMVLGVRWLDVYFMIGFPVLYSVIWGKQFNKAYYGDSKGFGTGCLIYFINLFVFFSGCVTLVSFF